MGVRFVRFRERVYGRTVEIIFRDHVRDLDKGLKCDLDLADVLFHEPHLALHRPHHFFLRGPGRFSARPTNPSERTGWSGYAAKAV